ncbi:MAG: hypothetical protein MPJ25_15970 [Pirellulales bacterium]|nr:hypothetical protein [Pirellulales bacterium]
MKEARLIEMRNKVETLGRLVQGLLQEVNFLKTMVMGDHRVLKEMKEFPAIIEKFKKDEEKGKSGEASKSLEGI